MDLFSFVAGILVGWLIEWLIDMLFWRRKHARWAGDQTQLQSELGDARAEVGKLQVQVARTRDLEQQNAANRAQLEARKTDLARLQTDLDGLRAQNQALSTQLAQASLDRQTLADRHSAEIAETQLTLSDLRAQLLQAEMDRQRLTDRYDAEMAATQVTLSDLRTQLQQANVDRQDLSAQIAELNARQLEFELEATRSAAAIGVLTAAAAQSSGALADDLTIIEGIGPKIAELLQQDGINSFAQLAESSVDDLTAILRAGGSRFQTANPETWPRQARLAANREWNKLDVLKAQLVAGVRRAPEAKAAEEPPTRSEAVLPEPADDLTILEGIGPKIAEILEQQGIRTFAQLAESSVDDLTVILRAGGSRFQTANPETWPRQARLAANREWNKLDVLKAQLVGGVRRAPEAKADKPDDATPAGKDELP